MVESTLRHACAWPDIPGDLTKQGTTVSLDVLPAGSHLTGVS